MSYKEIVQLSILSLYYGTTPPDLLNSAGFELVMHQILIYLVEIFVS